MGTSFRTYLLTLLLVAGTLLTARQGWEQTLKLGCLPHQGGVARTAWLDNCDAGLVGDYAHSAVWFDIEPSVRAAVRAAQVLVFGDSRILAAMSHENVPAWFQARNTPFYLLAFTYGEQSGWAEKLLRKFRPKPAIMIFQADPYFTGGESLPAQAIEADAPGELKTALQTKTFMQDEAGICRHLDWLCGRTASTYRSSLDGHLLQQPQDRLWFGRRLARRFPVAQPLPADTSHYEEYLANARKLLDDVPLPAHCIVFTSIPNSDQDDSLARFLAARLGATVISPSIAGLATGDHMHLTQDSAEAWTAAFLAGLDPLLKDCTSGARASQASVAPKPL